MIPSTGWVAAGSSVGYTVLEHILPVPHEAKWGFNGVAPIPGGGAAVPSISEAVGDSSAAVRSGVVGGVIAEVLATLTQDGVFGTVLLDWMAGSLVLLFTPCGVPPVGAVAACGPVSSVLAACGAPGAAAWSVCDG